MVATTDAGRWVRTASTYCGSSTVASKRSIVDVVGVHLRQAAAYAKTPATSGKARAAATTTSRRAGALGGDATNRMIARRIVNRDAATAMCEANLVEAARATCSSMSPASEGRKTTVRAAGSA